MQHRQLAKTHTSPPHHLIKKYIRNYAYVCCVMCVCAWVAIEGAHSANVCVWEREENLRKRKYTKCIREFDALQNEMYCARRRTNVHMHRRRQINGCRRRWNRYLHFSTPNSNRKKLSTYSATALNSLQFFSERISAQWSEMEMG